MRSSSSPDTQTTQNASPLQQGTKKTEDPAMPPLETSVPSSPPMCKRRRPCIASYVLTGNDKTDEEGALRLADDVPYIYRGCRFVIYVDSAIHDIKVVEKLRERNATVYHFNFAKDFAERGWKLTANAYKTLKYLAVDEPNWEWIIFRDVRSGIWLREKNAVEEWLESGLAFHSMRDSKEHDTPFVGNLWGMLRTGLKSLPFNLTEKLKTYLAENEQGADIEARFLRDVVYPEAKAEMMAHCAYFCNSNNYPNLYSKVSWGFPARRFSNVSAGNYWDEGGKAILTKMQETPAECRRRVEWTFG